MKRTFIIIFLIIIGIISVIIIVGLNKDQAMDQAILDKEVNQIAIDSYYSSRQDDMKITESEEMERPVTEEAISENSSLGNLIEVDNTKESPFEDYFELNTDYVGWISIEGTGVNAPIVKGRDNEFYLDRGFDKTYSVKGSIFMDYRNFGQGFDSHTIIYGHNMKDGSMFGELDNYMDQAYLESNPVITIEDLYNLRRFEVVSVYYESAETALLELNPDDDYENYFNLVMDKSMVLKDVNGLDGRKLLTLVTCSYEVDDGRYFIHALEIEN